MYSILTVGAGYLGGAIARSYQLQKQRVFSITRSKKRALELEAAGIQPLLMDLQKPETLSEIPPAHFIVIAIAPDQRDEDSYYDTYVRGVGNFLKAIESNPRPFLIVYISSTRVWEGDYDNWVDESTHANPISKHAKILVRAEEQVLCSGLPSVIFRLSGIYGPGRNRLKMADSLAVNLKKDKYLNMIHRDDIVQAIPVIFKSSKQGEVYIGSDHEPVRDSEFISWLQRNGKSKNKGDYFLDPERHTAILGKRLKNTKLRELGFEFAYPSFKEGYEALKRDE